MTCSGVEQTVVGVLIVGFLIGTTTHVLHLVRVGWVMAEGSGTDA